MSVHTTAHGLDSNEFFSSLRYSRFFALNYFTHWVSVLDEHQPSVGLGFPRFWAGPLPDSG
jgi:hypothetical protein